MSSSLSTLGSEDHAHIFNHTYVQLHSVRNKIYTYTLKTHAECLLGASVRFTHLYITQALWLYSYLKPLLIYFAWKGFVHVACVLWKVHLQDQRTSILSVLSGWWTQCKQTTDSHELRSNQCGVVELSLTFQYKKQTNLYLKVVNPKISILSLFPPHMIFFSSVENKMKNFVVEYWLLFHKMDLIREISKMCKSCVNYKIVVVHKYGKEWFRNKIFSAHVSWIHIVHCKSSPVAKLYYANHTLCQD